MHIRSSIKRGFAILLAGATILGGCAKVETSRYDVLSSAYETDAATTAEKTTQEVTTKKTVTPTEIKLVMVGDILLHENVHASALADDGTYNYDHLFTAITDEVKASDLALVNEEVILGGKDLGLSGYPMFNGPFEVGDALVKAGFNVILQATNHTLDMGKTGVLNNINFWKENYPDISYLGINESKERYDNYIYTYKKGDITVAILNYTYGTNGIPIPSDMPYIVNVLDKEKCAADIKRAKELADFVIVCPHWGIEYDTSITPDEEEWATFFADNGVDLIIGAHPHVVEPVRWVEGKDGHKLLCYYSVGNYVSGQDQNKTMLGAMAQVTIANDAEGNVSIKEYGVQPLITHKQRGYKKLAVYRIQDYSEELANLNYVSSTFTWAYCKELAKEVFGELYKD